MSLSVFEDAAKPATPSSSGDRGSVDSPKASGKDQVAQVVAVVESPATAANSFPSAENAAVGHSAALTPSTTSQGEKRPTVRRKPTLEEQSLLESIVSVSLLRHLPRARLEELAAKSSVSVGNVPESMEGRIKYATLNKADLKAITVAAGLSTKSSEIKSTVISKLLAMQREKFSGVRCELCGEYFDTLEAQGAVSNIKKRRDASFKKGARHIFTVHAEPMVRAGLPQTGEF
jgi:hypothetical protein